MNDELWKDMAKCPDPVETPDIQRGISHYVFDSKKIVSTFVIYLGEYLERLEITVKYDKRIKMLSLQQGK